MTSPVAVVDASVLVDALVGRGPRGVTAAMALADFEHLTAPDILDVECISAWWGLTRSGHLAGAEVPSLARRLVAAPIERLPTWPLGERLAELVGSITAYDAAYVALAELLDAPLLTADAGLARSGRSRCEVRVVGA